MSRERSMWEERLEGKRVSCFIATEEAAAQRVIRDRRVDGRIYTLERIGPEPAPYTKE